MRAPAFPCWPLESRLALAIASPALAYDTGPHSELTRDAMASEGFRNDAIGVAQVNNWFVDLYEQAGKNPYTGHGGFWKRLLTGAIRTEHWRDDVIAAADRSHFDSSTTYLFNTAGVTHEWDRLRRAVWTHRARGAGRERPGQAADGARREPAPGPGLLHAHELDGAGGHARRRGARLGRPRASARSPTWFDIPADKRDAHTIYTAEHPGASPPARQLEQRPQQEPDQQHEQGLAGPAAVARVGRCGVLRLPPVGRGGALVGRRRRLLAARAGAIARIRAT